MPRHRLIGIALATFLALSLPLSAFAQDSAKHDMKNAGTSSRSAARSAGSGIATGGKKAYHKTRHGTKKAYHKVDGNPNTK